MVEMSERAKEARRKAWREWYYKARANETPEHKEERLRKRREYEQQNRDRIAATRASYWERKAAEMDSDPE